MARARFWDQHFSSHTSESRIEMKDGLDYLTDE